MAGAALLLAVQPGIETPALSKEVPDLARARLARVSVEVELLRAKGEK